MWDDENEKNLAFNQVIAIVLMTVLVIMWFQFFLPKAPPVQPREAAPAPSPQFPTAEEASEAERAAMEAWPYLPPVPVQREPSEYEVTIENKDLRLVFTRVGARLKRAYAKLHNYGESEIQFIPEPTAPMGDQGFVPDAAAIYPLGLRFAEPALGAELDRRLFEVGQGENGHTLTFTLTLPNAAEITKTFTLADSPHVLGVEVTYRNLEPETIRKIGIDETPAYWLTWSPDVESRDRRTGMGQLAVWRKGATNTSVATAKLDPNSPRRVPEAEWIAIKSAYFVVALKSEFPGAQAVAQGKAHNFEIGLAAPRFALEPGAGQSNQFRLYMGPSYGPYLAAAWETLPTVVRYFQRFEIMDKFAKLLLAILNGFHAVIPSYGIAIILLTVLVRACMFPLTIKSMKSMKRIQLLAPEIEALKVKYKDEPQELQKRMMELYRERGMNPLGGCLPMALQMPVFIALYRMLWSAYELRGAPFVLIRFGDYAWIRDLSEPDRFLQLPFMQQVPVLGPYLEYIHLLPILMAASMLLQQKLMPVSGPGQTEQQKLMGTLMGVFIGVICYKMASGLNLYILTSTLLGIVQQKWMPVGKMAAEPVKKRPARKRQHFYTAAQARKRRLAKESKESGKRTPVTRHKTSSPANPGKEKTNGAWQRFREMVFRSRRK